MLGLALAVLSAVTQAQAQATGFTMIMSNPGAPADLVWISPDNGAESPMGSMDADGSMSVNTFDGHRFGWRPSGGGELTTFLVKDAMSGTTFPLPGKGGGSGAPPEVQPPARSNLLLKQRKKRQPNPDDKVAETSKGVGGLSFRNLAQRPLTLYWKNPSGGYKFQGHLDPGGQTGFQTYPGHQFIWAEQNEVEPPVPLGQFTIKSDTMIYPFVDSTTTQDAIDTLEAELDFREDYFEENGYDWIGTTYPRPAPTLYMHRPTHVGQKFKVPLNDSLAKYYHCEKDTMKACMSTSNKKKVNRKTTYQEGPEGDELEIEVVSTHPRAFLIRGFLSDFETDYVMAQAKPQLSRSTTGHGKNIRVDNVRTSKSAWLTRNHAGKGESVMDTIYRRIGIALKIPQELVNEGRTGEYNGIAENLNVLNYPKGGEYTPHYDVGADGIVASRWASGLLYLNTPEKGGGTSFPKAKMEDGSVGTYVDAIKGNFLFFYDLLEDGNVDLRSLHAGTTVDEGEKWVSPLWLWEPSRSGMPHGMGDLSTTTQEDGNDDLNGDYEGHDEF